MSSLKARRSIVVEHRRRERGNVREANWLQSAELLLWNLLHVLHQRTVDSLKLEWHGWHGFRRGIASNLYELGADEKIVQRILRHAKSHVTKDRYIKAFDPAVVAAMKKLEATVDLVNQSAPKVHQI